MSLITDNIDAIVSQKGLDRKEFFADIGITAQAYTQWRKEQSQPRLDKIFKIAEVLGVEPAAIFSNDDENKKTAAQEGDGLTDAQSELIKLIRQLDPDGVHYLKEKAQGLIDFQQFRDGQ